MERLRAINYGEATITATSKANANISSTCIVKVARTEAQITQLYFTKDINPEVSYTFAKSTDTFYGIIDEDAKTITIEFSYIALLSSLTNVKLHFSLSEGAKLIVAGIEQKTKETAVDISNGSVDYIVTAEDGITTQTYKLNIDHRTYAYIPNENFRNWLRDNNYDMKDDSLNTKHTSVINEDSLDLAYEDINDFIGIEFFKALTIFQCFNNSLTSLDVRKNIALEVLDISFNEITSLDISKNVALTEILAHDNNLRTLDLRGMRSVTALVINASSTNNPIETLKVHQNLQTHSKIKEVKTNRGTNVKIQTYSATAGSTEYTAVCCDYNPNGNAGAGECNSNPNNGSCP